VVLTDYFLHPIPGACLSVALFTLVRHFPYFLFTVPYRTPNKIPVLLPLCCPPLFSAPFSSAALLSSSCNDYRCCWCCPHCTRSPRCCCCCCCCVQCLCLHQLMVLLGYEQPWCMTFQWVQQGQMELGRGGGGAGEVRGASRSSLAATKKLLKAIPRQLQD